MSFSSDVREEIARVNCERQCCALAEMTGMAMSCGALSFRGLGRYALELNTESASVARRYFSMAKRWINVGSEIRSVKSSRLGGVARYTLTPEPADLSAMLGALDLLDEHAPFGMRAVPDAALLKRECCRVSFLRGAFLAGGSLNNPERAYHMEIAVGDQQLAECIGQLLTGFGLGARIAARKSQWVVYLKDSEHISDALTLLGAHAAVLALENIRIIKGVRNDVNRQVNCDNNNLEKTVEAAARQLAMIDFIEKKCGLQSLPDPLLQVAELRRQYPDASLNELGELLDPPIGKSGVRARLRKLENIAEELSGS